MSSSIIAAAKAAAESVADAVRDAGARALLAKCNVGSEAEIVEMFKAVDREFGYLDALVNNAGISGRAGRVDELDQNRIMELLGVNVLGPMLCCREAVRRMSTRYGGKGGAIVNVSSGSAYIGNPGRNVLYAVSKGGVNSLMSGLSQEVAAEGIRVNNISPGLVRTEMVSPRTGGRQNGPGAHGKAWRDFGNSREYFVAAVRESLFCRGRQLEDLRGAPLGSGAKAGKGGAEAAGPLRLRLQTGLAGGPHGSFTPGGAWLPTVLHGTGVGLEIHGYSGYQAGVI